MTDLLDRLQRALGDRYHIERELGRGGMATVYLAHDLKHDRSVALKVLKPELAAALGPERFLREITLTARLDHPHILPLLDSGTADVFVFYVMPYVEGESLRDRLNREKQLPVDDAIQITREVADALGYAHSHEVVHRDIKPENILLATGHARVADFGIARAITAAGGTRLTETGLAIGTPVYMSPEQATGASEVDGRSDVYSLSCVLYEMLAGDPPFAGSSAQGILARKVVDPVPSLRAVRRTVPEGVERALQRALATSPADRFSTAPQFARALDAEAISGPQRGTATSRARVKRTLAVVAVLLAGFLALWRGRGGPGLGEKEIRSIAVLPFANATADRELEYLSDGLTISLINSLADLRQLSVKSRSASFRYKGRPLDPEAAGRELQVAGVLTGTLERRGDLLLVVVELIDAATGNQLYGAQFSGRSSDLFTLEDDIARNVAQQLRVRLTPESERRLSRRYTDNLAAYDLYLRGTFWAGTFREEGLRRAIGHYRRALELDPRYALAHTGMAHAYFWFTDWYAPSREVSPLAIDAARRALEIDENLARAHGVLGLVTLVYTWDWPAAERAFLRALDLDPKDAGTRAYYAWLLVALGRRERALAEARQAQQLDSLNAEVQTVAGLVQYLAREYDLAIDSEQRAIDLDQNFTWAYITLGRALEAKGRLREATARLEKARTLEPRLPEATAALGHVYARAGQAAEARALLEGLTKLSGERHVAPFDFATLHVGLGERQEALDWLEEAYVQRSYLMPFLGVLPFLDPLRGEPRFQELLGRMELRAKS